jgi:hypothetical protein
MGVQTKHFAVSFREYHNLKCSPEYVFGNKKLGEARRNIYEANGKYKPKFDRKTSYEDETWETLALMGG